MKANLALTTRIVIDWIDRMATRYGGIVYDLELGRSWDWGQALCRQVYGPDWMHNSEYLANGDDPSYEAVEAAREWEAGSWPEWAERRT